MQTSDGRATQRARQLRPTWIALAALWCAVLANQAWIYGLLLLAWGVYDVVTGESVFVQRVTRREQPVTYWVVVSTWIALGGLSIAYAQ